MVTVAFSVLGLSEALSVILVYVVGFFTVPAGFMLWEWLDTRTVRGGPDDWGDEMTHPDGRAEGGTLLCDYVDENNLASIGKQKGIEPEPTRRERGTSTTRGRDVGGGWPGIRARWGRERREDERQVFDVEKDPNAVLRAVLERLECDGELDRGIGHAPPLGLDDRTLELVRDVQEGLSIGDLRERLIVAEKRRELDGIVERAPFVLIESEWGVQVTAGAVTMTLEKLRPGYLAYDRYGHGPDADERTKPIAVPDGLRVLASVPSDKLRDPVKTRLVDRAVVHAGVLATVASYRDGNLELAPTAVFGRYGAGHPRY